MSDLIYFRVHAGKAFGLGHLNRSITLYGLLKDRYDVHFIVWGDEKAEAILRSKNITYIHSKNDPYFLQLVKENSPDIVIMDCRDTKAPFISKIRSYTKVLALDDLGSGSHYADITIHSLPIPTLSTVQANFTGPDYLILSNDLLKYKRRGTQKKPFPRLLISFGGEDPYGLTEYTLCLIDEIPHNYQVDVVLGPLYKGSRELNSANIIVSPHNFYHVLQESDLIITSFGMTVYEALVLDVPVITINPTDYHNDLCDQIDGIMNLGIGNGDNKPEMLNGLRYLLFDKNISWIRKEIGGDPSIKTGGDQRIVGIIEKLLIKQDDKCPICFKPSRIYSRLNWLNQYHCFHCYTFFRSSDYIYHEDYLDDYFTDQYKSQYGKTYLEDKEQINRLNQARLKVLSKLSPLKDDKKPLRLLETGSAMGFFLELAGEAGYDTIGCEISKYASEYAVKELKLNILQGNFNELQFETDKYDLVVAWYFIEHHKDFLATLRKIKSLLKKGGVISLSTPNTHGMSFLNNPIEYINRIPKDHFIEFSPRSLSRLLKNEGFQIEKIVMTGLHFTRFTKWAGISLPHYRWLERSILWVLKKIKLGDTFEIYARKLNQE
ncbi:MAG: hypothetical protein IEMM0008_0278 [bacterium]|nr:MAG: hypothetical protein IEMM0008_0278 [bacterium]